MSDSEHAFIPIPPMSDEEYQACSYPFKALRPYDNDGVTRNPFQAWMTAKGHVPGTSFKIRARWRGDPLANRLAGFEVKINLTCATGHNVLLVNGVPRASELMLLQAKCWLRANGCSYLGIDKLDLESVVLKSVTPTYLLRLANKKEAQAARKEFSSAAAIRNIKAPNGKARRKKAYNVGDGNDDTAYLRERETTTAAYVKDRDTETVAVFTRSDVREKIFDIGECYLRVEPKLNEVWLRNNKKTRVEDWRLYGQETAYQEAFAVIRERLRLDEGLRARKPKESDIIKLTQLDQEVLRWHLDSDDNHQARNHPIILAKPSNLAQQQYFSSMKRRIEKKLHLDISVPWEKQANAVSAKFNALLHYPGMYQPPPELPDDVFGPVMASQLIHALKVRIDADRPRGIGRIHIPPELRAPPAICLGRLVVSVEARKYLDQIGQPLYPYLEAHQCGVFGDVTREEALALARAAAALEPVQSRYKAGDLHITVTTEYVVSSDGDAPQPVTTVRCSGTSPAAI